MATNDATSDLSDYFFQRWAKTFQSMGINPMFPLRACMHESECHAKAHNPGTHAVGLIQFMPSTLRDRTVAFPGTWREFLGLSAEQQIPWIAKFYKPVAQYLKSDALCYTAMYLPSQVPGAFKNGSEFHLCEDPDHGGKLAWAYVANPGFDNSIPKKGWIQVSDLSDMIAKDCQGERWDSLQARMQAAIDELHNPVLPVQPPANPDLPVAAIAGIPVTIAGEAAAIRTSNTTIIAGSALVLATIFAGAKVYDYYYPSRPRRALRPQY